MCPSELQGCEQKAVARLREKFYPVAASQSRPCQAGAEQNSHFFRISLYSKRDWEAVAEAGISPRLRTTEPPGMPVISRMVCRGQVLTGEAARVLIARGRSVAVGRVVGRTSNVVIAAAHNFSVVIEGGKE